jgi:probable phosphoglycerate mutase
MQFDDYNSNTLSSKEIYTVTKLYLVRHGESTPQIPPYLVGGKNGDKGLTSLGVRQAERLHDRLAQNAEIRPSVLIASPLPRARQTAEIIQPALAGVPFIFDAEVEEIRPGEADGLPEADFMAKYGRPDFRNYPERPMSPGGESLWEFKLRVATALKRITTEYSGCSIMVVCHGGVIAGSFEYFFGQDIFHPRQVALYTHNTSITHWQLRERPGGEKLWGLVSYNDDFHLRDFKTGNVIDWTALSEQPVTGNDQSAEPLASV